MWLCFLCTIQYRYDFWASTHFAGFTWWHTFPKVAVHPCLWATVVLPVQQHHYHQRCSWSRCCRVVQHSLLRGGRCHGRCLPLLPLLPVFPLLPLLPLLPFFPLFPFLPVLFRLLSLATLLPRPPLHHRWRSVPSTVCIREMEYDPLLSRFAVVSIGLIFWFRPAWAACP